MLLRFFFIASLLLFGCVAIERDNPDDPGSSYFGEGKMSGGLCGNFLNGTEREHYGMSKPQFCDARDGKKYVYVKIGSQTWMAENLNYNASGSKCYDDLESNCNTYGRLYSWTTANTVCPEGWRLPSDDDWVVLMKSINPGCYKKDYCLLAATNLKAANVWGGNGTDDYGFAALLGGGYYLDIYYYVGEYGLWWSSTTNENNSNNANYITIFIDDSSVGYFDDDKNFSYSVRCLKDN